MKTRRSQITDATTTARLFRIPWRTGRGTTCTAIRHPSSNARVMVPGSTRIAAKNSFSMEIDIMWRNNEVVWLTGLGTDSNEILASVALFGLFCYRASLGWGLRLRSIVSIDGNVLMGEITSPEVGRAAANPQLHPDLEIWQCKDLGCPGLVHLLRLTINQQGQLR